MYYLVSKVLLLKDRQIRAVGDRFLFKIPGSYFLLRFRFRKLYVIKILIVIHFFVPGMKLLLSVFNITPGTPEVCAEVLQDGHLLAIGPGLPPALHLMRNTSSFMQGI